ncbi:MAG: hypothetical protein WA633_21360 [Stellaceae bacterium]
MFDNIAVPSGNGSSDRALAARDIGHPPFASCDLPGAAPLQIVANVVPVDQAIEN